MLRPSLLPQLRVRYLLEEANSLGRGAASELNVVEAPGTTAAGTAPEDSQPLLHPAEGEDTGCLVADNNRPFARLASSRSGVTGRGSVVHGTGRGSVAKTTAPRGTGGLSRASRKMVKVVKDYGKERDAVPPSHIAAETLFKKASAVYPVSAILDIFAAQVCGFVQRG